MWALRWQSVVDFLVLLGAVYLLLAWGRQARALRIALGILAIRAGALLAQQLDLVLTGWVLDGASIVAVVLLLVVFQPELRHALTQLDFSIERWRRREDLQKLAFAAVGEAAFALARTGRGALIVIVRRDPIDDLIAGGVPLGGHISREIIEAIFRKVSPVHDGATIIEANHIARVGAVLPLTQRDDVPSAYGTRHRAGLGLAERSDAVVVVVSEERGTVTLILDRQDREIGTAAELAQNLEKLCTGPRRSSPVLRRNLGLKAAAVGLAALIWGIAFGVPGTNVRTLAVPVEFSNVPSGLRISRQSATTVQVQLRGATSVFQLVNLPRLAARLDLKSYRAGAHNIPLAAGAFNLPPGIRLERVAPETLSITLARQGPSP